MKNSKIVGIFLAIVIVLQNVLFFELDEFFIFLFALGLPKEWFSAESIIYIIILLSPIFFICFYFSESIRRLIYGYGKIYIIRKYSRTKLLIKEIGKAFIMLMLIVAVQTVLAYLCKGNTKLLDADVAAASVAAYLLGAFVLILLQMHLEFYIEPQQAAVASCLYVFLSYCAASLVSDNFLVKIIFFPSLMFGTINGVLDNISRYIASMLVLTALGICLILANLYNFKKSDIF